jgi:hypothetical protein
VVEVMFDELRIGRCVLSFDGRVLELLRSDIGAGWRLHVDLVALGGVSPPDRKGIHTVQLVRRDTGEASHRIAVDGVNLQRLVPVLDAITAARSG